MSKIPAEPIVVIGAGSWGTALALLLASNGNDTRLWGHEPAHMAALQNDNENRAFLPGFPFPKTLTVYSDLAECLDGVKDILIVVPSNAFREVLRRIKPFVTAPRISWGTKGVDPQTKKLLSEVVAEELGEATPIAIVAGPSFAEEVAAQMPTAISLASNNTAFKQDLIERLHNDRFRVYENDDLIGVQLCGVLKNILAIAVGVVDGLALGANTRAALVTRGLAEMARLNHAMGGQAKTLLSLAGIGDLVLTCTDDQSRNRRFGKAIGQGLSVEQAKAQVGQSVEGLNNTSLIYSLAQALNVDMPITEQVYRVLYKNHAPKDVIQELLERAPKVE